MFDIEMSSSMNSYWCEAISINLREWKNYCNIAVEIAIYAKCSQVRGRRYSILNIKIQTLNCPSCKIKEIKILNLWELGNKFTALSLR